MIDFKSIEPGKYIGLLKNWSMGVNPYLNTPEVSLEFEFTYAGEPVSMTYRGLYFKRDGGVNKKTRDTLALVGFTDSDGRKLNGADLDTAHEYELDIARNDKGYLFIDWVRRTEEGAPKAGKQASKSLDDFFGAKATTPSDEEDTIDF